MNNYLTFPKSTVSIRRKFSLDIISKLYNDFQAYLSYNFSSLRKGKLNTHRRVKLAEVSHFFYFALQSVCKSRQLL